MSNQNIKKPLVTVCIVTYNSSEFILDALESVFEQTYQNIELIVSDDCSKDNTVVVCEKWINEHAYRFNHAEVVTTPKNTGVSANCNRGIRKGTGRFVKLFAGDDKLLPNCIEDNMAYMTAHPDTDIVFSDMYRFWSDDSEIELSSRLIYFKYLTPKEFKIYLLIQNFLPAPASFFRKELYIRLGGFNESIPMMEDKPFYIEALYSKCLMRYMPTPTVCYRIGNQSISQVRGSNKRNGLIEKSREKASKIVLGKLKEINYFLYLYQKNEYNYQFDSNVTNEVLHVLRFFNPFFYYVMYLFVKIRVIYYIKNHY